MGCVKKENEEEIIMEDMTLLMNIMWTMIGAFLVYFMQAGFAMVEAGFTRAKNAGNIIMKNMMDFVLVPCFSSSSDLQLCLEAAIPISGRQDFLTPHPWLMHRG